MAGRINSSALKYDKNKFRFSEYIHLIQKTKKQGLVDEHKKQMERPINSQEPPIGKLTDGIQDIKFVQEIFSKRFSLV